MKNRRSSSTGARREALLEGAAQGDRLALQRTACGLLGSLRDGFGFEKDLGQGSHVWSSEEAANISVCSSVALHGGRRQPYMTPGHVTCLG